MTALLTVENVEKRFGGGRKLFGGARRAVHAVQGVDVVVNRGETLAIAGESGSGKSITSLAIMGLLPPPAVRVTAGAIRLGSTELTHLSEARMRAIRGDRIAIRGRNGAGRPRIRRLPHPGHSPDGGFLIAGDASPTLNNTSDQGFDRS